MKLPMLLANPKEQNPSWFWLRVLFKGVGLYVLCNVLFAALNPLPILDQRSIYGHGVPRVDRFQEQVFRLPVLFNAHTVSSPKSDTEYRVFLLGDSATYGYTLELAQTLSALINDQHIQLPDGRIVRVYNLAIPFQSVIKDLMLLDYGMQFEPDMVIWVLSPHAVLPRELMKAPLVIENPQIIRDLSARYDLAIDLNAKEFRAGQNPLIEDTLWGNRIALYSYIRSQLNGMAWGIRHWDHSWDPESSPPANDFDREHVSPLVELRNLTEPEQLTDDVLRFDLMATVLSQLDDVMPILVINGPIFISDGQNCDLYYHTFYPRWFYDEYRSRLRDFVGHYDVFWLDLWDIIPKHMFTDTPFHYSAEGSEIMAEHVGAALETIVNGDPLPASRN